MNKLRSLASEILNTFNLKQIKLKTHSDKQDEVSLQIIEKYFRQLLENVKLIAVLLDEHGKVIYVNPYLLSITGYTNEEMLGCDWFERIIPSSSHETKEVFSNGVKSGKIAEHFENPIITKKGGFRTIHWSNTLLRNTSGSIIGTASIGEDITQQKLAEKEVILLCRAVEQSPVIVIITNKKGNIVYVNPKFTEVTGYTLDEMKGKRPGLLQSGEHPKELYKELWDTILSGNDWHGELHSKKKNGDLYWVNVIISSIVDHKGDISYFVAVEEDITGAKKIVEELISAKAKAMESDRLKTVFLQNMSHEIRTPMNAIMGFSDLLTLNFNNKVKLQNFTNIIKQRSTDLLDLINEILDLSKIETGQLPINIEDCDLANLFKELHLFFINHRQKIAKTHIDLQFTTVCDPHKMFIRTDKGKLKQIFINLIHNALKFTDKGKIKFGCTNDDNNNLLFYVSDTGVGIPEDKQTVIFERFMQLDPENNSTLGGTGLGLSIVKGLVELLGGEIIIKSIVGKGSTFYFSLPYQIVESAQEHSDTIISETHINWKTYTILLVEDDIYNSEYLREVLLETEINILTANNAHQAIELVKSGQIIDIILMDVKMPGMSGYEATTIIKRLKPQIKIIAQTAYAANNDRQNAINAGCDNYISKPISKEVLLTIISKQLNPEK